MLLEAAKTFAAELIASYLHREAEARAHLFQRLLPGRWTRIYKSRLAAQLKEMPFIYRDDIPAELVSDFVEVDMLDLDTKSFDRAPQTYGRVSDAADRLRRNRRVLFLGQAGMGKTTYQRYAITQLIADRKSAPFIYPTEYLLPIYVPLKLVDNTQPRPILRHILTRNTLFSYSAKRGLARLTRLASRRLLFLFLDGYDEISFGDDGFNYVRAELNLLFGSTPTLRSQEDAVYEQLQHCRIWLASRREFFDKHVLTLAPPTEARADTAAAVELRGIGSHRQALVRNIFDKHRRSSELLRELLSEEYFISDIDRSLDVDVRKLSANPLFLTVMCYVYVSRVKSERRHDIDWAQSVQNLILSCVRLLLRDLDDEKARELPRAFRDALLRRRSAYPSEKEAFLKYIAATSFADGGSVFTLDTLRNRALGFFNDSDLTLGFDATDSSRIGRQLRGEMVGADIILQLVYAGVFVVVGRIEGERVYDFPHRRFREVLAVEYWAEPAHYLQLMADAHKREFREIVRFLTSIPGFQMARFQQDVLRRLLTAARHAQGDERYVTMVENYFRLVRSDTPVSAVVDDFLRDARAEEAPLFRLPPATLVYASRSDDEARLWVQSVVRAAQNGDDQKFNLGIEVLEELWPTLLVEALKNVFPTGKLVGHVGIKGWEVMLARDSLTCIAWWAQLRREGPIPGDICDTLAAALSQQRLSDTHIVELLKSAGHDEILRVLSFVYRHIGNAVERLARGVGWQGHPEWFAIRLSGEDSLRELRRMAEAGRTVTFISAETVHQAKGVAQAASEIIPIREADGRIQRLDRLQALNTAMSAFADAIEADRGRLLLEGPRVTAEARRAVLDAFIKNDIDYCHAPGSDRHLTADNLVEDWIVSVLGGAEVEAADLLAVAAAADGVVYNSSRPRSFFQP